MAADKLGVGSDVRELKLGNSFDSNAKVAFHSMRCDFKPASVDVTKEAEVGIGENHSVTVKVPHVEGSGTSHTMYKGNKRPSQKECVLIINHNTGEITLEKLANQIQLKKTRIEGSSRASQMNRPVTPSEQIKQIKDKKTSPSKSKKSSHQGQGQGQGHTQSQPRTEGVSNNHSRKEPSPSPSHTSETSAVSKSPIGAISDSSSSSDSLSSDSEEDTPSKPSGDASGKSSQDRKYTSMLSMDLQLSESGSDSD